MTTVNFYQSNEESIVRSLCVLAEKCYNQGLKTIIKTKDTDAAELLNAKLWTFAQKSFIPHGSESDLYPTKQPIYITTKDENPTSATALILFQILEYADLNFEKIFFIFDASIIKNVDVLIEKYKEHHMNYYVQNNQGQWIKRV